MRHLVSGKGSNDHVWSLVYHSKSQEGVKGLMDTLETTVVKGGSAQMQKLIAASTRNQDATMGFSSMLANISQTQGERLLGTLLLTSDGEGGKEADVFGAGVPGTAGGAAVHPGGAHRIEEVAVGLAIPGKNGRPARVGHYKGSAVGGGDGR